MTQDTINFFRYVYSSLTLVERLENLNCYKIKKAICEFMGVKIERSGTSDGSHKNEQSDGNDEEIIEEDEFEESFDSDSVISSGDTSSGDSDTDKPKKRRKKPTDLSEETGQGYLVESEDIPIEEDTEKLAEMAIF